MGALIALLVVEVGDGRLSIRRIVCLDGDDGAALYYKSQHIGSLYLDEDEIVVVLRCTIESQLPRNEYRCLLSDPGGVWRVGAILKHFAHCAGASLRV